MTTVTMPASSNNNNKSISNNVSGKMKSREIFTSQLDFLLALGCIIPWAKTAMLRVKQKLSKVIDGN